MTNQFLFLWGRKHNSQLQIAIINTMVQHRGKLTMLESLFSNQARPLPMAPTSSMAPRLCSRKLETTNSIVRPPRQGRNTQVDPIRNIQAIRITIRSRDNIHRVDRLNNTLACLISPHNIQVCLINNKVHQFNRPLPVEIINNMVLSPPRGHLFPAASSMDSPPHYFTRQRSINRASRVRSIHKAHRVRGNADRAGKLSSLLYP